MSNRDNQMQADGLALEVMLESRLMDLDEPLLPDAAIPFLMWAVASIEIIGILGILTAYLL